MKENISDPLFHSLFVRKYLGRRPLPSYPRPGKFPVPFYQETSIIVDVTPAEPDEIFNLKGNKGKGLLGIRRICEGISSLYFSRPNH